MVDHLHAVGKLQAVEIDRIAVDHQVDVDAGPVVEAAGSGKPVLVSVIADWDISVHGLKRRLEKPAVRRMLRQRGFVLLEANLTDWNSPLVGEIETLIGSDTTVPTIAVFTARGGVARVDLPGSMSEAEFMEAIELSAHLTRRNSGRERK